MPGENWGKWNEPAAGWVSKLAQDIFGFIGILLFLGSFHGKYVYHPKAIVIPEIFLLLTLLKSLSCTLISTKIRIPYQ